jgi:YHS domain-containing protein
MDRFVSFLLFAVLFYFMMRFGCGAHTIHGHQGHHRNASAAKDPVCGTAVAADSGYSERYEKGEYRFCSRKCLDQFDANPQQFATAQHA